MEILHADLADLKKILELQYIAYQSEAKLYQDYTIPPLMQTLKEVESEYNDGVILKAVDENKEIIGSVRGYVRQNTLYIGKLIVHPIYQGRGIGRQLLTAIEQETPATRYEIFTGSKSTRTILIYKRMGYQVFCEKQVNSKLTLIYLEKLKHNI